MSISKEEISSLLNMISTAAEDSLDCDGCFKYLAEFADLEIQRSDVPEALKAVEIHLQQCACCKDEYQTLLEALRKIQ